MRKLIAYTLMQPLSLLATFPAFAHWGHVGELAGHGHLVGLGALAAAAALAAAMAAAARAKSKREDEDQDAEEAEPEIAAEGEAA